MTIGIYSIESPNNRIYIGQSRDLSLRFKAYKRLNCNQQPKVFYSLKKYGIENHIFEVIEECKESELDNREEYWKKYYLSLVDNNLKKVLFCSTKDGKGGYRSEETKRKIGNSNIGTRGYPKGKPMSEESSILKSLKAKGKPKPKGFGELISKTKKGVSRPYQNKRVRDNNSGIIYSSITQLCEELNISSPSLVTNSLKGLYKKSKWDFSYE